MRTVALTEATWPAFAALTEAHGGIFGGCWCLAFHAEAKGGTYAERRDLKAAKVRAGKAHAALVMEGDRCLGWAQYGGPAEVPNIRCLKSYEATGGGTPDWRITCFFVDMRHRRAGVAAAALEGALALIGEAGGGTVEGYPEAIEGQKTAAAFLWGGTVGLFERAGFVADRKIGMHRWVMRREVRA